MGAELNRIHQIDANPPKSLSEATAMYLDEHGDALEELEALAGTPLQEYYRSEADVGGTAPMAALLEDMSSITMLAGQSGIQFQDKLVLGPLTLGKTILLNGQSGLGKSTQLNRQHDRLNRTSGLTRTDFTQALPAMKAARVVADADADIEMTPFDTMYNLADFDDIQSIDCSFIRGQYEEVKYYIFWFKIKLLQSVNYKKQYLEAFFSTNAVHCDNIPWVGNADRMKCLYKQIIAHNGWMHMQFSELEDKLISLNEAGDSCAGQFFIQISDSSIPARNYSTAKLSTPGIRNARASIISGCTPHTALTLMQDYGPKGVVRRVFVCHIPTHKSDIDDQLDSMFDENGQFVGLDHVVDYELEAYRDFEFWKFLMKQGHGLNAQHQPDSETIDPHAASHYFKQEIPVVNVTLMSPVIKYTMKYRREHKTDDPGMALLEYPGEWLDNEGNLNDSILTSADVYLAIKRLQMSNPVRNNELASVMLMDRHIRTYTLAYALSVRDAMLKVKSTDDAFTWDMELPYAIVKAAEEIVQSFDEYVYTLCSIPTGKNASRATANSVVSIPNELSQHSIREELAQTETKFKKFIMARILEYANPTMKSSDLTRRLRRKAFKKLNNLEHIKEIILNMLPELFEVTDASNHNKKSKYWMVRITRLKLSVATKDATAERKLSILVALADLGTSATAWSETLGWEERKWVREHPKL